MGETGKRILPRSARKGGARLAKKPGHRVAAGQAGMAQENNTDKPRGRRAVMKPRRRLSGKELAILILPAIAALIAVAIFYNVSRDLTSVTLDGAPVQYYGGNTYRIWDGAVLHRTGDEKTVLMTSNNERTLDALPIYFEEKETVFLPEDMAYYAPRSGKYGRIPFFSEIRADEYGRVIVRHDENEQILEPGFLFDGKDLYLFLEPVIVSFNGYSVAIPALSYVEAVHTGDVMVFDFGVKQAFMEAPNGPATANVASGDYSVSLLGDFVTLHDGSRTLLFTRPEQLELVG